MGALYLFTWNLSGTVEAHDLALDHLAEQSTRGPFVACLQELPGASEVALARESPDSLVKSRGIAVVSTKKVVRGLALAHHPSLEVVRAEADDDGEFLAAVFRLSPSGREVGIVGVHAKSKVDMHRPEDHGGSRALLRHALHALQLKCDHVIVLGDFNSPHASREMQSWHGFYALGAGIPLKGRGAATRRGYPHPALRVVRPWNDERGTFVNKDSGGHEPVTIDYIVADQATHALARSGILPAISGRSLWNAGTQRAELSDHLPVEGSVDI